ncbi:MAG: autotransporter outer membrane beta-barrel domain-containing protein [Deltaproteobacteria bacterium]|nr:autotransporter outer membrane beta-barrel domain-containing protein [Deltaproteobacteria bacterium]
MSQNTELRDLSAYGNQLTWLDVSQNPELEYLYVYRNQLTWLDVSQNPELYSLEVGGNQLTWLDVSQNHKLEYLYAYNNQLTWLDVSQNPELEYLYVYNNQLTGLDVDVSLSDVAVSNNRLPLSQLFSLTGIPNRNLGMQTGVTFSTIPSVSLPGTEYSLASEAVLGGQDTVFTLELDGSAATQGVEYSMTTAGILTFLDRGEFIISMHNPAVHNQGTDIYGTSYGTAEAVVTTSPIDVLPVGAQVSWNGGVSSVWLPSSTGAAGKDWLHSGFAVRYLESPTVADDVVFGSDGERAVKVDPAGVHPDEMTVEANGFVFSGGRIDGRTLTLSAPAGSAARFSGQVSFSSGVTLHAGNRLVLNNGFSASTAPALAVIGGSAPAVLDTGSQPADFSGAALAWIVPQTARADDILLEVAGQARIAASTQFLLAYASGRPDLALGESIVLLDAATLSYSAPTPVKVSTPGGDVFTVGPDPQDASRLLATLSALSGTGPGYDRMKAYPEAAAAALAFLGLGQDLLVSEGAPSAVSATAGAGPVWGAFAGMAAGRSRYETGSHVDVSGFSVMAGAALGTGLGAGRLTLGIFMEAGKGDYDSHNAFASSAKVDGGGDAKYAGGGILARWDAGGGPLPGLWLEASARTGRQETDFSTDDILYNGARATFEIASRYWGLHGGIGRKWRPGGPDGAVTLDLGARVLWTRQEGSEVMVNLDRVRFEDADSLRLRAGGRVSYDANPFVSPYFGAYFEREFDGAARASVNGVRLETPSLKGNTGIFEMGVIWKPSGGGPLSLEFGGQGYAGKREGFAGKLNVKLEF